MTTNNSTDNVISRGKYQAITRVLTASDIAAMMTSPFELIPAPGANKVIICTQGSFQMIYGGTPFTGGGTIRYFYGGTSNDAVTGFASTVVTASANTAAKGNSGSVNPANLANTANKSVTITNDTSAFAGGNSKAIVKIWYMIIDTV